MRYYAEQYRRRLEAAEERAKRRADYDAHTRTMQSGKSLKEYEEAYFAWAGTQLSLSTNNGWVKVGGRRYRLKLLPDMTRNLWAQVHERKLENEP